VRLVARGQVGHPTVGNLGAVPTSWSSDQLRSLDGARELEITSERADGTLRRWVPVWVVRAGDDVFVRTWFRRTDGWFGHAVKTRRARVRVTGLEVDVVVEDVGDADISLRSAVDEAYRDKYGNPDGGSVGRMVSDEAAATTLRLFPRR
jgi:hypothetical protein